MSDRTMQRALTALGLAALLGAGGCMSLAPEYQRPAAPVPAAYPNDAVPTGAAAPAAADVDWQASYVAIRQTLLATFATVHSLALQQTLFEMGRRVLARQPEVVEVRLSAPNIHHFAYDLERFGLDNNGEVFHADDRPYGLIEGAVVRDGAPDAGPLWDPYPLI